MKKIKDYIDKINDEINGSKEYIEKALWYKAKNDANRYTKYKIFCEKFDIIQLGFTICKREKKQSKNKAK